MVVPNSTDAERLAAVRAALPALDAGIYLNTGSVGPLPAETAAAMADAADRELRLGRAHPDQYLDFLERMGEARAAIAAVLVADVDEIALTHATTDGMNVATWAVDWKPGDRAVTTNHEHAGGFGPLVAVRDRFGVEVTVADIGDGGDDARTLDALDAAITPRTRLVTVSHVLWTTGARLPLAEIAEIAHARGARLAVDGAQAVGAIPVDVHATGADAYAVAGQKWLLGPEGSGAVWIDPSFVAEAAQPYAGWFSFERAAGPTDTALHRSARRFEASNWYHPAVVGLARSVGWLSMFVGLAWIHERGAAMARTAADGLAAIPGVELLTPRDRMATLVTFRIAGWPAEAALTELAGRTFVIARTIPVLDAIRLSVGCFTTQDELRRVLDAVELLAGHTPQSLPPRSRLTILGQDG